MRAFYCDHFVLPLPTEHRFPMKKYARLRERAIGEGVLREDELFEPSAARDEDLLRAHSAAYVHKVKQGAFTRQEIRRMGFPWSPQLVERSKRSSGGTIAACWAALEDGMAVNLAGGTHHAGYEHGEGYCVFNDSAVAARAIQAETRVKRVLVIDCDVHQGNGTAAIFQDDTSVFTFSIHGEKNFPFRKVAGDLDIGLADNTGDEVYLDMLEEALHRILAVFDAGLAIYLAGADPYKDDTLGKLALSKDGLAKRDALVLGMCVKAGIPIAVTMAGGYAKKVDDIVDIHLQTIGIAKALAEQSLPIGFSSHQYG